MGMFSSPKFAKRTQQEAGLYQEAQAMQGEATQYGSAVRARLADVANLGDEKIRAGRTTSADFWQAMPREYDSTRPSVSAFGRAMLAGKARSRIAAQGDAAVEAQAMRDRAALSSAGDGIRSGNIRDVFQLSQGYDNYNAAKMQANQTTNNAWAGVFGTAGGMGLGAAAPSIRQWWNTRGLAPINVTAQRIGGG